MENFEEGELSPEEEAEIKKKIEEAENSPAVQRELNKMRFKDYLIDCWGRALIVFVLFGAFSILVVKTQHRDDFISWVMIGIAGIAAILAVANIVDIFLHRQETKRVRRGLRNSAILIALCIIFFGIAFGLWLSA